jgi:hypothetical protein
LIGHGTEHYAGCFGLGSGDGAWTAPRPSCPDPYLDRRIPANHLTKGQHLKTPNGTLATADGGSVPADHVGWVWDLTVPGNNDHDFYIETVTGAVLVHNASSAYVPPPDGKVLPGFPDAKYGTHLGEFDPNDGSQNKPGEPGRSPSGC